MKKTLTRISTLLMALLILAISVVATGCGDTGNSDNSTDAASTDTAAPAGSVADSESQIVVEFPDKKFNENFTIYQRSETASSYPGMYIYTDQESDLMSASVYRRNVTTEDKYGVTIISNQVDDPYKNIESLIKSDSVDFDVILDRRNKLASLSRSGYLYNFNNLNIDYTTPWWDANCAADYDINGKLFFMANDVSVSNLAGARFFYFNKDMIDEYKLQQPYDLVAKDQWTLENLLSLVSAVRVENGDGVQNGQDFYGLLTETGSNSNVLHLLVGCGTKFSEFDSTGLLTTTVNNQKTDDILTKVANVLKTNPQQGNACAIDYAAVASGADTSSFNNKYDYGRSLFAEGHFLFVHGNMHIASQFSDMVYNYGVVPNPKYNTDQKEYAHKMDAYSIIWAIPNHPGLNTEKISYVMDFWAYTSSQTVMPTYYEITIKTRRVQDPTASDMLDTVKATIQYDLSELYGVNITDTLLTAYKTGNLSSTWKSKKNAIEISLQKLVDDIDSLQ